MTDDTVRLSSLGQVLRGRWRTLVVLAVLGALVGAGASLVLSPGYQTTASVLIQGPREPDELLTQAQVATSSVVLDRAAAALGWPGGATDLADRVSTSVKEGNIVTIKTAADTPEQAQRLADQIAGEFIKYSAQILSGTTDTSVRDAQDRREALRQQITQASEKITELSRAVTGNSLNVESVQARTELQGLRRSLEQAMEQLNSADTSTGLGAMVVMGSAERPLAPAAPTMLQLVLAGAVLFFVLGILGHLFAARADRRLRDKDEIAAALGGPVLGMIDVPADQTGDHTAGTARRLLHADRPWDVPRVRVTAEELGEDVRIGRLLARVADRVDREVIALVATGDATARAVAERLAELNARPRVEVVEYVPGNPVVAESATAQGVLLVLTLGTRTSPELAGLADACYDAGLPMLGAGLARPVTPAPSRAAEPIRTDDAMAGSV